MMKEDAADHHDEPPTKLVRQAPAQELVGAPTRQHPFFSSSSSARFRGVALGPQWTVLDDSCLYRSGSSEEFPRSAITSRPSIASFDFDDTLVSRHDDQLSFPNVATVLELLFSKYKCRLVIFTNETLDHLKAPEAISKILRAKILRIEHFLERVKVPVEVFVATRYDEYRKPGTKDLKLGRGGVKMWTRMVEMATVPIDLKASGFVGDAAGGPGTHSDADLIFAQRVGVKFEEARVYFGRFVASTRPAIPPYRPPHHLPKPHLVGGQTDSALGKFLAPGCRDERLWFQTDHAAVVYDAYPKAQVHVLIIPRRLDNVHWVGQLQGHLHSATIAECHALARAVAATFAPQHVMRIGYHARPSMKYLHIHVISADFQSDYMNKVKHWNAFTLPSLFVPIDKVESDLARGDGSPVQLDEPAALERAEKQPVACWRCQWRPPMGQSGADAVRMITFQHICSVDED